VLLFDALLRGAACGSDQLTTSAVAGKVRTPSKFYLAYRESRCLLTLVQPLLRVATEGANQRVEFFDPGGEPSFLGAA